MCVEEDSFLVSNSSFDGFPGGTWPSHFHFLSFHFFLTRTKQEGTSVRVYSESLLKSRAFYAVIVEILSCVISYSLAIEFNAIVSLIFCLCEGC